MRVGFGYDVHRLVENRKLILGGVHIPFDKGLMGNSDADVLIHAIVDAMLGAAAKGDIGKYFPGTEIFDSRIILSETDKILKKDGYRIVNIDTTVVTEKPKLAPYIDQMRKSLSDVLELELNQVSIKGKTTEGLGFTGTCEGIAAYAVVLIDQADKDYCEI